MPGLSRETEGSEVSGLNDTKRKLNMNFTFDGPEALHIVKRFDLELRKDLARLPNGRNSDPETCDARRKTPDENSKNLNGPSRKKHQPVHLRRVTAVKVCAPGSQCKIVTRCLLHCEFGAQMGRSQQSHMSRRSRLGQPSWDAVVSQGATYNQLWIEKPRNSGLTTTSPLW